jgi:hypothetical protein
MVFGVRHGALGDVYGEYGMCEVACGVAVTAIT